MNKGLRGSAVKRKSQANRENMQILVRNNSEVIPSLFWDMFNDLPLKKQKAYLERAKSLSEQSEAEQITLQRPSL